MRREPSALPSEAPPCNDINDLLKGLGEPGRIEADQVSGVLPKLSRVAEGRVGTMLHDEFKRLDPGKEEVAASQRSGQCLQGHFVATRQSRNGELLGLRRRTHDRIVLVMEIAEAEVTHPSLMNELELPLEIRIARDEEQALLGIVPVLGLLEIGSSAAKQSVQLGHLDARFHIDTQ